MTACDSPGLEVPCAAMTTIAILPSAEDASGKPRFEAVTRDHHASGSTVGQAIDALNEKLGTVPPPAFVFVQPMQGDEFFGVAQITSLRSLMDEWRRARDVDALLDSNTQGMLSDLVDAELSATIKRCQAVTESQ